MDKHVITMTQFDWPVTITNYNVYEFIIMLSVKTETNDWSTCWGEIQFHTSVHFTRFFSLFFIESNTEKNRGQSAMAYFYLWILLLVIGNTLAILLRIKNWAESKPTKTVQLRASFKKLLTQVTSVPYRISGEIGIFMSPI